MSKRRSDTLEKRAMFSCGILLAALLGGCSGDSAAPPTSPVDPGTDASVPAADSALAPRSEACLAMDAKLQAALDKEVKSLKSPDGAIAVTTPACGYSEYFSGKSALNGTLLFRIGSVTKTYVAGVILKLVTEGKMTLADPLESYVPGIKDGTALTIRELLNHSSGLYNYTDDPALDRTKAWTPDALVDLAKKHDPYFAPGAGWHYSNTNYILLGMVAEKVGGKPLAELIRQKLLIPFKLEHTFLDGSEPISGDVAKGYGSTGKEVTYAFDSSWAWAAGAMVSTANDVSKWVTLVAHGDVYTPQIQKDLLTGVETDSGFQYGLGIFLFSAQATGKFPAIGHGGDINGCHSQAFYFPKTGMTVVAIVNKDGVSPNSLSLDALDILMP